MNSGTFTFTDELRACIAANMAALEPTVRTEAKADLRPRPFRQVPAFSISAACLRPSASMMPTTFPFFEVVFTLITPLPPRDCNRYSSTGVRLPGRKEITDRHAREERRWRTDALRAGLGVLARSYRDRAVAVNRDRSTAGDEHARAAVQAVSLITEATQALPRNPQESLLLQSLLVRLGALTV